MDRIADAALTLEHLEIHYAIEDNNGGTDPGPLPSNFTALNRLTWFEVAGSNWTTIPAMINNWPQLDTLYMYSIDTPDFDWGDLSNLVNLRKLTLNAINRIYPHVPAYLPALTNLKTFNMQGCFKTDTGRPGHIDLFIGELYTMVTVTVNPPKTGTSADAWRSVTYDVSEVNIPGYATTDVPAGIYQQPAGYVQGTSNGTPATSLEKFWVLDHQYSWKCNWKK